MHIFDFAFTPHHRGVIILKKQIEIHSPAITDTNLQEKKTADKKTDCATVRLHSEYFYWDRMKAAS